MISTEPSRRTFLDLTVRTVGGAFTTELAAGATAATDGVGGGGTLLSALRGFSAWQPASVSARAVDMKILPQEVSFFRFILTNYGGKATCSSPVNS